MNRIPSFIIVLIILLGLLAWSPWVTQDYAEGKATQEFTSSWEGVIDGCGFNCDGCGVKSSQKKLFGYSVTIGYGCGMKTAAEAAETGKIFVSAIGTVHGPSLHAK